MKFELLNYLDIISSVSSLLKEDEVGFEDILNTLIKCYQNRGIVYTIGCGGSSSTASHFTADLSKTVGGFKSICLSDNTPLVSAITNDLGWENVFEYQLKNWMGGNDVLVVFSVHGGSKDWSYNLIKAMKLAKK